MTTSRLAAFVLALAALAADAVSSPQAPATVRVGTWNLEQLGFRRDPPRTDADLDAIAAKVRDLRTAVLAVQEIGGEGALDDLCRRIGPKWRSVLGTTGTIGDGGDRISVGFVWDDAVVELLQAEELLQFPRELEGKPVFHRVPVTASFRVRGGGADFRLVTVHFKAGQQPDDFQKRRLEASTVRDWLENLLQRPGEDQDVLLLGDFNHGPDADPRGVLERGGFLRSLKSGKKVDPTIVHFDTPIDAIAASRGFAEVVANTFDVHNEGFVEGPAVKKQWSDRYTDHFPLTVEVEARADDDPQATFARGGPERALPLAERAKAAKDQGGSGEPTAGAARGGSGAAAQDPRADGRGAANRIAGGRRLEAGARVVVTTLAMTKFEGRLEAPLPEGPGGWLLLRLDDGGTAAIPFSSVQVVRTAP